MLLNMCSLLFCQDTSLLISMCSNIYEKLSFNSRLERCVYIYYVYFIYIYISLLFFIILYYIYFIYIYINLYIYIGKIFSAIRNFW